MRIAALAGLLALLAACKDPELQAAEAKARATADLTARGRAALLKGRNEEAVGFFRQAASNTPADPTVFLLLAQAHKAAGNESAAVLAIRQAEDLGAKNDPAVKRERAELYRSMGQTKEAIATLLAMRDANQLTDAELLLLARMQAHDGDAEAGYKTLERVQSRKPDDIEAKVVEAEILLASGDEVLAAKLMDRLLQESPGLVAARVLRARYFMQNGYPEVALKDLEVVPESAQKIEVVELKARALIALKRYDEAAKVLQPMVDANPRDANLIAQLAETQLYLGQVEAAQGRIDEALALKPRFARALYVRGRTLEAQGEMKAATEQYKFALKSDPGFAPALSRVWPIYERAGDKIEAMNALERLFFLNEATLEEKVSLATLYAETGTNLARGRKLIDEAVRLQPENAKFKELKGKLGKSTDGAPRGPGVVIIKKGH